MMARVLLVASDLSLVREWIENNPEARVWVWGQGLPLEIKGLEGRVLPASLTRDEAEGYGAFDEIIELPLAKKKASSKKVVAEPEPEVAPDESEE